MTNAAEALARLSGRRAERGKPAAVVRIIVAQGLASTTWLTAVNVTPGWYLGVHSWRQSSEIRTNPILSTTSRGTERIGRGAVGNRSTL